MSEPARRHFFISYNSIDKAWAEWIAATLEAAGYTFYIQAWHFRPGQNFVAEMQRAATLSDRTIAVLSPNFLASGFTAAEWAAAFAQDPMGIERRLVPVRVVSCKPGGLLRAIIYIDLVGKNEESARAELLSGLSDSGRPQRPPPFPGTTNPTQSTAFPGASDPLAAESRTSPSRTAELRKLIARKLRLDSDLDAFCLDYFPEIKRRFTLGMDRLQKESLLLECADTDELAERLRTVKT